MGGYTSSIGKYRINVSDYVFDYIKRSKPKKYYDEYLIDMEFIIYLDGVIKNTFFIERNKEIYDIKIPLNKLGKINKLKKYYEFVNDFDLKRILWEEIHKRNIIVEGYPTLTVFPYDNISRDYYLTSKIGKEPISITSEIPKIKTIVKDYYEHCWLEENGFVLREKFKF